jgi:hypothetical protein
MDPEYCKKDTNPLFCSWMKIFVQKLLNSGKVLLIFYTLLIQE